MTEPPQDSMVLTKSTDVVCPDCRHPLTISSANGMQCPNCGSSFPLIAGHVPSLLPKSLGSLKSDVMRWWDVHNMDLDYRTPHPEYEKGTWEYFRETDRRWFIWGRPILHTTYPMLHRILTPARYIGKRVLEVGCGVGTMLEQFAALGSNVSGIDLAPRHAYLSWRRTQLFALNARVFHADAENLPFANDSFDFVFSWGVLHHTPNTKRAIEEIYRVLVPGGEAFLMLYHRRSFHYWYNKMFTWGILRGKLLTMTPQQVANRSSDGVLYGGSPLSQWFSKPELMNMMKKFENVKISLTGGANIVLKSFPLRYLQLDKFGWPAKLVHKLNPGIGFLAVVEGKKPSSDGWRG